MKTKRRKPWIAAILSLLCPAVGYAYGGRIWRGIIISFLVTSLYPAIGIVLTISASRASLIMVVVISMIIGISVVWDCYKSAKNQPDEYTLKPYNKWWSYIAIFIVFGLILSTLASNYIRNNQVQAFRIPAGSMLPTMEIGDHLLVDKGVYKKQPIKRGDIIVFEFPIDPSKDFIKRVVAVEGEVVEIKDKILFINGVAQDENYIVNTDPNTMPASAAPRDNFGPFTVPANTYFVMGDNRDNSFDSRFWGVVDKEKIKGKAMSIYWSWNREEPKARWDRIGKSIK